jgi:peptidoglycan hydrolase-like protein with peptidoglycan-binding domain
MARRRKAAIEEDVDDSAAVKPLSVLLWSVASIVGVFIVYNAFMRQPPEAVRLAQRAATTWDDSTSPKGNQNTVVLRYDPAIEEVQRELLATGHYKGLVDGVNGNQTRLAIEAYLRDNNLALSVDVTPRLLEHMRFTRKISDAAQFTGSTGRTIPAKIAGAPSRITQVQRVLADLGYEPGEPSGIMNAATHNAIRKFETEQGLVADGEIDSRLLAELAKTTGYEHLGSN